MAFEHSNSTATSEARSRLEFIEENPQFRSSRIPAWMGLSHSRRQKDRDVRDFFGAATARGLPSTPKKGRSPLESTRSASMVSQLWIGRWISISGTSLKCSDSFVSEVPQWWALRQLPSVYGTGLTKSQSVGLRNRTFRDFLKFSRDGRSFLALEMAPHRSRKPLDRQMLRLAWILLSQMESRTVSRLRQAGTRLLVSTADIRHRGQPIDVCARIDFGFIRRMPMAGRWTSGSFGRRRRTSWR